MNGNAVRTVVIVGGGSAGWMTAAALAHIVGFSCNIRLIESDQIRTVGVGESTVPHIRAFNNLLGIDEIEFIRQTQATFKLGIHFRDWGKLGDEYIHGFGLEIGRSLGLLPFHHYWIRAHLAGRARDIGEYTLPTLAASRNKFTVPALDVPRDSPLASIAYAYHIDAGLYARYLRGYAEKRGVARTEGLVEDVILDPANGNVRSIRLQSGEVVEGDLFVDCSGFRGVLIEQALHTGYIDWTHWLPCNSAQTVLCEKHDPLTPYTRASAQPAGWQWRIPLQHRTGNGYVYSNRHVSDDEATATLLRNLDGKQIGEPWTLRFTTGRRKRFWNRNVVAIGLSSGFIEPLESTSIHLIQQGISRLLNLWPREADNPVLAKRYNDQMTFDFERIRDFIILHYHATERDDTEFWNHCRTMTVPETLQDNLDLFRDSGRFFRNADELFAEISWVQVMMGQRIMPRGYHPIADRIPDDELFRFVDSTGKTIANCVDLMPMQQAFIDRYCKAPIPA